MIAKFLSDAAWYFYLFWLPKYLYDARGFDIKAVATFALDPAGGGGRRLPRRGLALQPAAAARTFPWTAPARSPWARAPP